VPVVSCVASCVYVDCGVAFGEHTLDGSPMLANLSGDTYRLMMDHVQTAVFAMRGTRFIYVNPSLTEIFGYSAEEMLNGMDPLELTAPEDRDRVQAHAQARKVGAAGDGYEVECLRKDGSRFSAQVRGIRIDFPDGAVNLARCERHQAPNAYR
jgi:PAS domain S-box-containing protein